MAELPVNSTSGLTNNTWATTVNVVPAANAVTAIPTINPVQTSTVVSAASLAQSSISSTPINITPQAATPLSVASAVLPTSSTINTTPTHPSTTTNSNVVPTAHPPLQGSPARATLRNTTGSDPTKVLDKHRLQELVKEVDPLEQMDDEVEEASSIATPDLSHLTSNDYNYVYEPAEDSFLMLDALEKEAKYLRRHFLKSGSFCLEVGSGSGIISTFIATILGPGAFYLCTDINHKAAEVSQKTGLRNSIQLNPVVTDLTQGFGSRLHGLIDVLLFNPPYVVTPSEEVGSKGIEASWAGGKDGREVLDRFMPLIPKLLADNGVFYLVIIKENKQDDIEKIMSDLGLTMSVVITRRSGPEFLSILKFVKANRK